MLNTSKSKGRWTVKQQSVEIEQHSIFTTSAALQNPSRNLDCTEFELFPGHFTRRDASNKRTRNLTVPSGAVASILAILNCPNEVWASTQNARSKFARRMGAILAELQTLEGKPCSTPCHLYGHLLVVLIYVLPLGAYYSSSCDPLRLRLPRAL